MRRQRLVSAHEVERHISRSLNPELICTSNFLWDSLREAGEVAVALYPMRSIVERLARRHPTDWSAFYRSLYPYLVARLACEKEIVRIGLRFGDRGSVFQSKVDRLLTKRAKKLLRTKGPLPKISELPSFNPQSQSPLANF